MGFFAQERPESGLAEMLVWCERIDKPVVLHHHKRDTVGEAPGFVGSTAIEI